MKIWILEVMSESSDHYGPYMFSSKPTQKQLENFLWDKFYNDDCGEFPAERDGCGEFGSNLHIKLKPGGEILDPKQWSKLKP